MAETVREILIVTLSNIGDVVVTTPVISYLAHQFPDAKLTVVVGPRAKGALAASKKIARIVIYDKTADWRGQLRFLREIRDRKYDYVVDLRNTAIPFLVNTRRRSSLFPPRVKDKPIRDKHLSVLWKMGFIPEEPPVFDFYKEEDRLRVLNKLHAKGAHSDKDWIVIAPIAASGLKTWPFVGYRAVLEGLIAERSEEIILVGAPKDKKKMDILAGIRPSRIFSLAGETDLCELAALIANASLVLANDSSILHFSYELNRPSVAIFGPTNPKIFGRQGPVFRIVREEMACSPCEVAACQFERQACFDDLKPEKVLDACLDLLSKKCEV